MAKMTELAEYVSGGCSQVKKAWKGLSEEHQRRAPPPKRLADVQIFWEIPFVSESLIRRNLNFVAKVFKSC